MGRLTPTNASCRSCWMAPRNPYEIYITFSCPPSAHHPLQAFITRQEYKRWMQEKSSMTPDVSVASSSEESINDKPSVEPVEALIIRFGDVTIEKNRCPDASRQADNQRLFFHEIEQLNSTKSSATKDRILRRLLMKVSCIQNISVLMAYRNHQCDLSGLSAEDVEVFNRRNGRS